VGVNRLAPQVETELIRLMSVEKDALARYVRIKRTFYCSPDVVECARVIWANASADVIKFSR
jgi:hypothetical protein